MIYFLRSVRKGVGMYLVPIPSVHKGRRAVRLGARVLPRRVLRRSVREGVSSRRVPISLTYGPVNILLLVHHVLSRRYWRRTWATFFSRRRRNGPIYLPIWDYVRGTSSSSRPLGIL